MMSFRFFLIVALLTAPPVTAQQVSEQASFTISVAGLTAGRLTMAINRSDSRYAVKSQASSAGLAGLFASFEVKAEVAGRLRATRFQPEAYTATATGGRAGRGAQMRYKAGVPTLVEVSEEPRPGAPPIDPETMGGTVDPLTGMYGVLQTVDAKALCQLDLELFDGHRHSAVSFRAVPEDPLRCHGVYRRLNGYSAADLAERRNYDFDVTYAALSDGRFAVAQVVMEGRYGTVRVTRD